VRRAVGVAAVAFAFAPAAHAGCPPPTQPPAVTKITHPRWVSDVLVTEYFPAPERWFRGRLVHAPGLVLRHRSDWLYSARGLAMQGEGIGSNGRFYHFAGPYSLPWRNARGARTYPCIRAPGYWTNGRPARISAGARFALGPSLALTYWHDVAVDPRLIAYGSSVFVPAYCSTPSHGWFVAADTGGAILGRHIDVYRAPPSKPWASRLLRGVKIFVVPPGFRPPPSVRCPR
jgi:3D (Asp-Asp-Asp) domain-containing protein